MYIIALSWACVIID